MKVLIACEYSGVVRDAYVDMIGYDPFLEGVSSDEVRDTLLDYVKEECYLVAIHVNEVGL